MSISPTYLDQIQSTFISTKNIIPFLNMAIPQRQTPPIEELRRFYVGKNVNDVPKPAVILDKARIGRHCQTMLDSVDALGLGFRAHVKTHKVSLMSALTVSVLISADD
jgi:hypothetical protein